MTNQSETMVARKTKGTKRPVCNSALNFQHIAEALEQLYLTCETVNKD